MDDTPSTNPNPVEPPAATDASTAAAHAAAVARAAEQAADASLVILRSVAHAILWLVGGVAMAIVADSLPWGLSGQLWIKGAVLLPMSAVGFELGRRASPRLRRRAAVVVAFIIGLLAGYAMDRIGGALITAPVAAAIAFIINLLIDAIVSRLSPVWRLHLIWGAWACLIACALLALVIRLVIGKNDGDDFAFYAVACVIALSLANHHDWFADSDLTLTNFLRRLRSALAQLLHRRIAPFFLAMIVSYLIAGPLTHQPIITEGDIVTISSAKIAFAWPACFAGAAVLALAGSLGAPAPVFRKAMVILALICSHSLINVAVLSARFDDQTVEGRSSIWSSFAFKQGSVTRIDYVRRTGRRTVYYEAIIHQIDGSQTNIGSNTLSRRAVEWMRDKWGVPEQKWR